MKRRPHGADDAAEGQNSATVLGLLGSHIAGWAAGANLPIQCAYRPVRDTELEKLSLG